MEQEPHVVRLAIPEDRARPIETHCDHPAVSLRFRLLDDTAPAEFVVRLADGRAELVPQTESASVDIEVQCPVDEFRAMVEGRTELMGPFWSKYLPNDFGWASGISAFLFPEHPYRGLNPVIDEIYTTPSNYPTITPFPQAYTLHSLVRDENLALTFEIGLAFGASALLIAEAHRRKGAGHHFAVDPFQTGSFFRGQGLSNLARSGLEPYVSWIPQRARPTLSAMRQAGLRFDLVYIDGDHSVAAVLSDFVRSHDVLKRGGYLAFDDSHMPSGVKVLEIARTRFGYDDVPDLSTDRFTLLRKSTGHDDPLQLRTLAVAAGVGADVAEWGRNRVRTARGLPHH